MKSFFCALLFISSSAQAHGPIAEQASKAVQKVTALFLEKEKAAAHDKFESISATQVGDERFSVKISLKEGALLEYECGLDTAAKPVKWGCKKK